MVEVYPAASLHCWGLPFKGYKGAANRGQRKALITALLGAAPWLQLGPHAQLCAESDDALDAVIAAVTARAAALAKVTQPRDGSERAQAEREGWIALPTTGLDGLRDGLHGGSA